MVIVCLTMSVPGTRGYYAEEGNEKALKEIKDEFDNCGKTIIIGVPINKDGLGEISTLNHKTICYQIDIKKSPDFRVNIHNFLRDVERYIEGSIYLKLDKILDKEQEFLMFAIKIVSPICAKMFCDNWRLIGKKHNIS